MFVGTQSMVSGCSCLLLSKRSLVTQTTCTFALNSLPNGPEANECAQENHDGSGNKAHLAPSIGGGHHLRWQLQPHVCQACVSKIAQWVLGTTLGVANKPGLVT